LKPAARVAAIARSWAEWPTGFESRCRTMGTCPHTEKETPMNNQSDYARLELARRGRNAAGLKTGKTTVSCARRGAAVKRHMFDLSTKELVSLAAQAPTVVHVAPVAPVPEPSVDVSTGSICLDNSSTRTLAHVAA